MKIDVLGHTRAGSGAFALTVRAEIGDSWIVVRNVYAKRHANGRLICKAPALFIDGTRVSNISFSRDVWDAIVARVDETMVRIEQSEREYATRLLGLDRAAS